MGVLLKAAGVGKNRCCNQVFLISKVLLQFTSYVGVSKKTKAQIQTQVVGL